MFCLIGVIIFVLPLLDGGENVVPLRSYEDTKQSVICREIILLRNYAGEFSSEGLSSTKRRLGEYVCWI